MPEFQTFNRTDHAGMKSYLDCIPCFIQQTLAIVRKLSNDESLHRAVLRKVLRLLSDMNMDSSPPAISQKIHRIIREMTGNSDPYKQEKMKYNEFAMSLLPKLAAELKHRPNQFEVRLRLAIAGNLIDFGKNPNVEEREIMHCIQNAMHVSLNAKEVEALRNSIQEAADILYLGDNSGEIVFDRFFIEYLTDSRITFVVRGAPIINDATMKDAIQVGMTGRIPVISNESDAPGTILENCSAEFQKRFTQADLIIAKGQGNYETLSHASGRIFFLLQSKCPVVTRDLGCNAGDFIIARNRVFTPVGSPAPTQHSS